MKVSRLKIPNSLKKELIGYFSTCSCPASIAFDDLFSITILESGNKRKLYSELPNKNSHSLALTKQGHKEFDDFIEELESLFKNSDVVSIPEFGVVFSDRISEERQFYHFFADFWNFSRFRRCFDSPGYCWNCINHRYLS